MTNETRDKIIEDAIEMGFLVEVCAGCGKPYTKESALLEKIEYKECGCPAGRNLRWNTKLLECWEKELMSLKSV